MQSSIQQQLADYLALLQKWNKTYNLTSIDDPAVMTTRHIADSLSISPFLIGQRILDVGTGAGLPGIPLALSHPDKEFFLLDSNGKKIRFLQHVVQTLKLNNVHPVQARVEKFNSTACFSTIMSRAFSSLADFVAKTRHLCCPDGLLLAMKGTYPTDELTALGNEFKVTVHPLTVPGLQAERHLVCILPR